MLTSFLRGLATLTLTLGLMMMACRGPRAGAGPDRTGLDPDRKLRGLGNTEARIRTYTPQFDNVNGFNAGGFYAITLGPYTRAEAQRVLGNFWRRAASRPTVSSSRAGLFRRSSSPSARTGSTGAWPRGWRRERREPSAQAAGRG
jgi:hypothetical protein